MVAVVLPVSKCGVLVCGLFLAALATAHNSAWEAQMIQKKKKKKNWEAFTSLTFSFEPLAGNLIAFKRFHSSSFCPQQWQRHCLNYFSLVVQLFMSCKYWFFIRCLMWMEIVSAAVRCSKPWWKRQKENEVQAFASCLHEAVSSGKTEWNKRMIEKFLRPLFKRAKGQY